MSLRDSEQDVQFFVLAMWVFYYVNAEKLLLTTSLAEAVPLHEGNSEQSLLSPNSCFLFDMVKLGPSLKYRTLHELENGCFSRPIA